MSSNDQNRKKRKVLRVNMAQSLDGHVIQPDGRWTLGSKEDKRRMDRLRLWADCLIASRRSLVHDNPNLFARSKPKSQQHPRPIVILNNLDSTLPGDLRIFSAPHPPGEFWLRAGKKTNPPALKEVFHPGEFSPEIHGAWEIKTYSSMKDIVQSLLTNGRRKILLEGGPTLNGFFLEEDLIDEIFFTLTPYVGGGLTTDRLVVTNQFTQFRKFRLLSCERRKDELFLRYQKLGGNA